MSAYPYKVVIFDFDGTLVDSFDWFVDLFDQAAPKFGYLPFDRSELADLRHMGPRELMRRQKVTFWKLPALGAYFRKHQGDNLSAIRLFDGVAGMINDLYARGVVMAVVTSNAEDNVRAVLGADLSSKITHFACGSSLFGKADKFRKVIRAAGVMPEAILSIGDELRDIEAARVTGVRAGAVSWGYADVRRLRQAQPDCVFLSPAGIAILGQSDV